MSNWRSFAEREQPGVWSSVIEALAAEDRRELTGLNSLTRYDVALQNRVLESLIAQLPGSESEVLTRLTAFEARQDLTVVHRLFLRMADPAFLVEQGARLWGRFYDQGRWRTERVDKGAEATLYDFGRIDPIFVPYVGHYFLNAFPLVGAKEPRVHWRLVDDEAHFKGSWS